MVSSVSFAPWIVELGELKRRSAHIGRGVVALVLLWSGSAAHAQFPEAGDPGGPRSFWASQPVGPNETVLAASGNTDSSSTVEVARLPDDSPGLPNMGNATLEWQAATVLQSSNTSIKFLIPASWPEGVYAYRIRSHGASSGAALLNAPNIWFIHCDHGESSVPGGWLQVHGTAIATPRSQARLALVNGGRVVAILTAEPGGNDYMQRYRIPVDLRPDRYEIFAHNGHGGPGAWTRFQSFVDAPVDSILIAPAAVWSSEVVDVTGQAGSTDDERFAAAIEALNAHGGGVLYVPAGTYSLTRQLALPDRTTLRGVGKTKSTLQWVASPMGGGPNGPRQIAMITGALLSKGKPDRGNFAVQDIGIVAAPDFVYRAIDVFSSERGGVTRVSIQLPNVGDFDNNTEFHPTAIFLRNVKNFEIVDSDLDASRDIFARDGVSFLRIENNRLNWRDSNIWLSGRSHGFLVVRNIFNLRGNADRNGWAALASKQKGTNPNPGFWFTSFYGTTLVGPSMGGPYARDLYYANNRSSRDEAELPPFYTGMTFDGSEGIYLGKVASVDGTTLHLNGTTLLPPNGGKYDWVGAIAQIVDGRGAGQWRYLVHATAGASEVNIDQPWDVEPDGGSTVNLVNLQGRVLMVDNDFAQEQTNQNYFFAVDLIKANNTYGVEGSTAGDSTWLGKHYHGLSPGWHLQVLDNHVVRGSASYFKSAVIFRTDEYSGPSGAYQVFRNNRAEPKVPTSISITSRAGRFADAVVEGNVVTSIDLGPKPSDPIDVTGIVLRRNTGGVTGNLAGRKFDDESVVRVLP
jgi:hypothetical protein